MKRFLIISTLFAFVFTANAYDFIISNIAYSFDLYGTSVVVAPNTVTAYQGNIIIPEKVAYNGVTYNVIGVGEKAFQSSSYLKSVTLPNSIKTIGGRAFYGCSALTKVNIPEAVTVIGEYAFYGCSVLADITIPNSVTLIGDYAFQNCKLLAEINIPNSVIEIGSNAFNGCM